LGSYLPFHLTEFVRRCRCGVMIPTRWGEFLPRCLGVTVDVISWILAACGNLCVLAAASRVMWTLVPSQYQVWHHRGEDFVLTKLATRCILDKLPSRGTRACCPFHLPISLLACAAVFVAICGDGACHAMMV
jgi:hypothetical protein